MEQHNTAKISTANIANVTKSANPIKRKLSYTAFLVWLFGYGGLATATAAENVKPEMAHPPAKVASAATCKFTATSMRCSSGRIDKIDNTGSVDLKGTVVSGDTNVAGNFKTKDAKLNQLRVAGSSNIGSSVVTGTTVMTGTTKLHDSQFAQPVQITGNVTSAHDTFATDLTVTGNMKFAGSEVKGVLTTTTKESHFAGTHLNKIDVRGAGGSKTKQVIYLQDRSTVAGDINFASGHGTVYVGTGSTIAGKVVGGEVVKAQG